MIESLKKYFASEEDIDEEKHIRKTRFPTRTTKELTLLNIYEFYKKGELDINAAYQRSEGVWPLQNKKDLIDSIIYNRHIPAIVVNDANDRDVVIDGKQRISVVVEFQENKFATNDHLYFNHPIKPSLAESDRRNFLKSTLTAVTYEGLTEDQELVIFEDLQKGRPLTTGEKLNAGTDKITTKTKSVLQQYPIFNNKVSNESKRMHDIFNALKLVTGIFSNGTFSLIEKSVRLKLEKLSQEDDGSINEKIERCFKNLYDVKTEHPEEYNKFTPAEILVLGYAMSRNSITDANLKTVFNKIHRDFSNKKFRGMSHESLKFLKNLYNSNLRNSMIPL